MKSIVAVFFVVVGLISVQETKADVQPCCTADQFEVGYGGHVGAAAFGQVTGIAVYFRGGFDFQGRRYGMDVYESGTVNQTFQLIQFFQKNTQYVIMNSQCYKSEITTDEPNRCVPDAAKYDGSFYLGNSELLVDNWKQDGKAAGLIGYVYGTTSRSDCTPGGVSFMGEMDSPPGKTKIISSGGYLNFTKGIPDPDRWFKVPSICNSTVKMIDPVMLPLGHWNLFQKIRPFV